MPQANLMALMGQQQQHPMYQLAMAAPDAFWNALGRGGAGYPMPNQPNIAYNGNATGRYFAPTGAGAAAGASVAGSYADRDAALGVEWMRQQGQNQRLGAISPLLAALLGRGGGGMTGFTSSFGQGVDTGYRPMQVSGGQQAPSGMNPQKFANDAWKADKRAKAQAEGYW